MRPLDDSARQWVDLQLALMHRAVSRAIDASNRWHQLNDELMAKFAAEGRSDLEIARVKSVNLALNDLYSAYAFHAGKAQMHAAVLQGELAARKLLDDPAPTEAGWPASADGRPAEPPHRPRRYPPADEVHLGGLVQPGPLADRALRNGASPTSTGGAR